MAAETPDQLFERVVKGRYKLAEGTSSAKFWAPIEESLKFTRIVINPDGTTTPDDTYESKGTFVPRPDRNMKTLQWISSLLGFIGIDHFYLRSPATGILKMLTLGGFGLWYVWDMLQVWLEKDRVLNYGLSTPFDLHTGIGQGMITDLGTKYTQETSFFMWTLATIFGFTGADMFATNQIARGTRILILFILAAVPLISFLSAYSEGGFSGAVNKKGYIGTLVSIFWLMVLGFGVFGMWGSHIFRLLVDPKNIMKSGMPNPELSVKVLRWYEGMFVDKDGKPEPETAEQYKVLQRDFAFTHEGTKGVDLTKRFWIGHDERVKIEGGQNESSIFKLYFIIFSQVFAIIWGWLNKWIFHPIKCLIMPASCLAEEAAKRASDMAANPSILTPAAVAGGLLGAQGGGAREESLSTEAKIIGASLAALIGGGALKGLVDYLMVQ